MDRLELLAQEHFALAVAELLLNLGLDVLLGVEDRDLPLDVNEHGAQPILHRQCFEQLLGFAGFEVEVAGHQIGKAAGLRGLGQELLHRFLGHAGAPAELGGALPGLAIKRSERGGIRIDWGHLLGFVNRRHQILILLLVTNGNRSVIAVEQEPHPRRAALDGADSGHRSHGVQDLRRDVLEVFSL